MIRPTAPVELLSHEWDCRAYYDPIGIKGVVSCAKVGRKELPRARPTM